jgi:hypothetical protein
MKEDLKLIKLLLMIIALIAVIFITSVVGTFFFAFGRLKTALY